MLKYRKNKDTRKKSIIKALTWRVIATLTTATLVFITTGSIEIALEVGALDVVIKLLFYYFHERAWAHIH